MGEPTVESNSYATGVLAEWEGLELLSRRATAPERAFEPSVPNVARMYDYLLGGKDHYTADRAAADRLLKLVPDLRTLVWENRYFLGRAVRELAERGVRQFLDIGSGLPTRDNTHEILRAKLVEMSVPAESGRCVYVDNDRVAVLHGRLLAKATGDGVAVIEHDLRLPTEIVYDPEVRAVLDFDQPVGVLLAAIMHFVQDDEGPGEILRELWEVVPEGSYLVLSHAYAGDLDAGIATKAAGVYASASAPMVLRTAEEIEALITGAGWQLIEPGLCEVPDWRPDLYQQRSSDRSGAAFLGGVAIKPVTNGPAQARVNGRG
ncbi:SAM-dependent methyltransferase [Herbidospora sp. NEAU-GS84]|uniref:SAM-dependent methyltransferase n=1 Tax=Herbidospora solisilvae TaxID=2696284 RepID=A0A7C9JDR1_9ACTN|nr:SAM-dependent methyltransferase [Herbidospora solisilvae]NAS24604.1 SAM-dependent methyltransferase [Herbidospora solisilvae]